MSQGTHTLRKSALFYGKEAARMMLDDWVSAVEMRTADGRELSKTP